MDLELKDRVYIVTGAARGLGRATADELVKDGASVVVSGRSQESLDAAVTALGDLAGTGDEPGRTPAVAVVADNADEQTPARLVAAARESFGRLDGLVVSVGGPPPGPVMETSDEDWARSFESVFLGAVRIARAVAGELAPGGSITFVLSSSVKAPIPGLAVSNGLRPGLAMVAKNLADELGPRGIRVNGLMPGRVGTERVAELDASTGDAAAARARTIEQIPLGRYGEPEEFGRVAAFLASPAASFVSGVMLPVDGGMLRSL